MMKALIVGDDEKKQQFPPLRYAPVGMTLHLENEI